MNSSLRIATWNTNGPAQLRGKHAHLSAILFDVAAVQECEFYPLGTAVNTVSNPQEYGTGIRHISILSPHRLEAIRDAPECTAAAFVDSPVGTFLFVSVWVRKIPSGAGKYQYVNRLPPIFDWARTAAAGLPCVIAGDFNCNAAFDSGRGKEFSRLVDVWKNSHGLMSSWHHFRNTSPGIGEEPTWRSGMRADTPEYMIDYIFVPTSWAIDLVRLQELYGSDHRPVIADVRPSF